MSELIEGISEIDIIKEFIREALEKISNHEIDAAVRLLKSAIEDPEMETDVYVH